MRAANMQSLTNDMKVRWPGMTIYGVGDDDHRLHASDHNEDDTPGSRAEQSDADSVPEHRAIDCMVTAGFTKSEAAAFVYRLVADAPSQRRLNYVIWQDGIWSRNSGWNRRPYDGEFHSHVHVSGLASDDENTANWPIVFASGGSGPTAPRLRRQWPSFIPTNEYFGHIKGPAKSHGGYYAKERPDIQAIQERLNFLGYNAGAVDGVFGDRTKQAVTAWQRALYSSQTSRYGEVWTDDWKRLFTY
jgi:hypothetical protein